MKKIVIISLLIGLSSLVGVAQYNVGDTIQFEDMTYDSGSVWSVPGGFDGFEGLSFNDLGVFAVDTVQFEKVGFYQFQVNGFVNYNAANELILEIDGEVYDVVSFPESSVNWWSDPMTYDDVNTTVIVFKPLEITEIGMKEFTFRLGEGDGDLVLDWAQVNEVFVNYTLEWTGTPPSIINLGDDVTIIAAFTAPEACYVKAALNIYSEDGSYLRGTIVESSVKDGYTTSFEPENLEFELVIPEQLELSSSLAENEIYRWDVTITDTSADQVWLTGLSRKVVVEGQTGSMEPRQIVNSVYPNPSLNGIVTIYHVGTECESVSVYNPIGKKVPFQANKIAGQTQLLIDGKGLFIIQMEMDNAIVRKRVLIQ